MNAFRDILRRMAKNRNRFADVCCGMLTALFRRCITEVLPSTEIILWLASIMKLIQEFFNQTNKRAEESFLKRRRFWPTHSPLQPVIDAAVAIEQHWRGVFSCFKSCLSVGFLEGTNSLIQGTKARPTRLPNHKKPDYCSVPHHGEAPTLAIHIK